MNPSTSSSGAGISGLGKIITAMPDQPIINLDCQSRQEIKNALQLLFNRVVHNKVQDTMLTSKYLATQLIAGFIRLVHDSWRLLQEATKNGILNSSTVDNDLIIALGHQFLDEQDDYEHMISLFFSERLCNLLHE